MIQTHIAPTDSDSTATERWMVLIFNDDYTPVDNVVEILIFATNCDIREALDEVWEAEHFGKAPVHFASRGICDEIAEVISSIGVKTEVAKEWAE